MNKRFLLFCLLNIIFFASCSSSKSILYLQDSDNEPKYKTNFKNYKVKYNDILKIDVKTQNPEVSAAFNNSTSLQGSTNSKINFLLNGSKVDVDGNINYQGLGVLHVAGKTTEEIRDLIFKRLTDENILVDPAIDVKLINSSFTIIGEVAKPGNYDFLDNNLNILEAIGMAGDLTINGKRKDVKLIRNIENESIIFSMDLTTSEIFSSDAFQILPGDIILVNPNNTRVKNAGIIGNSGTLISLLSFLLSSIIVINN